MCFEQRPLGRARGTSCKTRRQSSTARCSCTVGMGVGSACSCFRGVRIGNAVAGGLMMGNAGMLSLFGCTSL